MKRPNLIVNVRHYTVRDVDGVIEKELDGDVVGYTCESVHMNFDGTVTFFCSGKSYTTPADDVVGIEYTPSGADWCPHCDQSIAHFVKAD